MEAQVHPLEKLSETSSALDGIRKELEGRLTEIATELTKLNDEDKRIRTALGGDWLKPFGKGRKARKPRSDKGRPRRRGLPSPDQP